MADRARTFVDRYARRIGSRMRDLREARSWTERDLARRLEVQAREISRWESGAQLPPLHRLLQMAEALGVEPGDLLGRGVVPRGGLGARLQAAHRRCGPDVREAVAALFDVLLALLELDEASLEGLAGALEIVEGAARHERETRRAP